MKKAYLLNTLLAAVLGVTVLAMIITRTFFPLVILPRADVPNLVLVSLLALLLEHWLAPGANRCYVCIPVLSALTFGLLPYAGGFAAPVDALKLAVSGGAVFTLTTWLFDSTTDRLSSGPAAKAAPMISAVGLYLASQCMMGMLL